MDVVRQTNEPLHLHDHFGVCGVYMIWMKLHVEDDIQNKVGDQKHKHDRKEGNDLRI